METRGFNPEHHFQAPETTESNLEKLESEKNRLAKLRAYREVLETAPTTE